MFARICVFFNMKILEIVSFLEDDNDACFMNILMNMWAEIRSWCPDSIKIRSIWSLGLLNFQMAISSSLFKVMNSCSNPHKLEARTVHFWARRVKYLHFAPSVSQFWSNTMSCQQSVGHDHLLQYFADRGPNCRTFARPFWLVSVFYADTGITL